MKTVDKDDARLTSFEESQDETNKLLDRLMLESNTEEERLSWALRKAIDPAWNKWLRDDHPTTGQIIEGLTEVCAQLICETAYNLAQENKADVLVGMIGKNVMIRALKLAVLGKSMGPQVGYSRDHA